MNKYADWEYYTFQYGGEMIPEPRFDALARRASAEIDKLTFNRLAFKCCWPCQVSHACCAIAETLMQRTNEDGTDIQVITSEKIDNHSITYSESQSTNIVSETKNVAATYLWSTGLMSAAVGFVEV